MTPELTIVHLYPDLLRTYGDLGNVLALRRRAEWRGFSVEVVGISHGERIQWASPAALIFMGGGTDRVQEVVSPDLLERGDELRGAVERGAVLLGICGGYQLFGHRYVDAAGGEMQGLGLLDVETIAGEDRLVGRVVAEGGLWDRTFELVGFENHGGRTTLGPGCRPLATVSVGGGNNGSDRTEGAVQGAVVGTYLHGPVLPSNPALTDCLLERALSPVTSGRPLTPLNDSLEEAAHQRARDLANG